VFLSEGVEVFELRADTLIRVLGILGTRQSYQKSPND
jgi:hypothetical protein